VHRMAKVVDCLETTYRSQLRRHRHPLLGAATCSVGTIHGGSQANIVPDNCVISVDRRSLPGETEESVIAEMKALLRSSKLRAEITSFKQDPCLPMETSTSLPFVKKLMQTARQKEPLGVDYFCDASVLAQYGIPSVVFGPGDIAQAHTA